MANPFGITEVDVPGILGAYEQRQQRSFQNRILGRKMQQEDEALAVRKRVGSLAGAGDLSGAKREAATAGDFDLFDSLGKMDESQRKTAKERAGTLASVALAAKSRPYEARKAFIAQSAPTLKALGYTDEQLAQFDPTDDAIDAVAAEASDVDKAIDAAKDPETIRLLKAAGVKPGTPEFREAILGHVNPSQFMEFGSDASGRKLIQTRGMTGGGDPTSGDGGAPSPGGPATGQQIEQLALSAVPGATVTSRARTPEHNRAVGGVPNSYHVTDQARDLVPPRGMTMSQFYQTLKGSMPGFEVINEGDHIHIEPQRRGGGQPSGPRVIASTPPVAKVGWRDATREEKITRGVAPDIAYQVGPEGQFQVVGGQDTRTTKARAVPDSTAKRISESVDTLTSLDRAVDGFKDEFAGNTLTGGLESKAQALFGNSVGTPGQRKWWADFAAVDNQIRNQLFGAALTETEKAAYEKTTISERMSADAIRDNLSQRRNILKAALARQSKFLKANKYDPEAVDALFATDALSGGGVDKPMSPQEAAALPSGTPFIGLDGKRRVRR